MACFSTPSLTYVCLSCTKFYNSCVFFSGSDASSSNRVWRTTNAEPQFYELSSLAEATHHHANPFGDHLSGVVAVCLGYALHGFGPQIVPHPKSSSNGSLDHGRLEAGP